MTPPQPGVFHQQQHQAAKRAGPGQMGQVAPLVPGLHQIQLIKWALGLAQLKAGDHSSKVRTRQMHQHQCLLWMQSTDQAWLPSPALSRMQRWVLSTQLLKGQELSSPAAQACGTVTLSPGVALAARGIPSHLREGTRELADLPGLRHATRVCLSWGF